MMEQGSGSTVLSGVSRSYRAKLGKSLPSLAVALGMASCLDRPISEISPRTTNIVVDQVPRNDIDKLDLLFVIDNSQSMADKQLILAQAVPRLLERLVQPLCISLSDGSSTPSGGAPCGPGFKPEFRALSDIHIGIITSSLGGHGARECGSEAPPEQNDRAHLLPSVRAGLTSTTDQGFLKWDPRGQSLPPGEASLELLNANFTDHVSAVREQGCGYEATLEAWYRFLIEPNPPHTFVEDGVTVPLRGPDGNVIIDHELLTQRAAFLRQDSLVAIIMLSDENDCSGVDYGLGWLTGSNGHLWKGSSECDINPNDPCCRYCGLTIPNDTCPPLDQDPKCEARHIDETDGRNTRCFDQKRRFGIDLLHPTWRYVQALTEQRVLDVNSCTQDGCALADNPLFSAPNPDLPRRDASMVYLAGIVGVPWQDIATPDSLEEEAPLRYRKAGEIDWSLILPLDGAPPKDPLMIATWEERSGTHPILGAPLVPSTSTDPQANPINGHESAIPAATDLQYACIFPLTEPKVCGTQGACDCSPTELYLERPLCNPPEGGPAATTQHYAKAYPGTRFLEVLRGLGKSGIVASICPKTLDGDPTLAGYGYNPAVQSIIDTLPLPKLERCLPRPLPVEQGSVPCRIVEASRTPVNCEAEGRLVPDAEIAQTIVKRLIASDACGPGTGTDCAAYSLCELEQLRLDTQAGQHCANNLPPVGDEIGYCYVDPARGLGDPSLVAGCPETERQALRFVPDSVPRSGATTFIACIGEAFGD